jgi:hypothetical protein
MLWVENGLLSSLEYFWTTVEPPTRLPIPTCLRVNISDADLFGFSWLVGDVAGPAMGPATSSGGVRGSRLRDRRISIGVW